MKAVAGRESVARIRPTRVVAAPIQIIAVDAIVAIAERILALTI
jgi:hypothetical protein